MTQMFKQFFVQMYLKHVKKNFNISQKIKDS